MIKDFIDSYNEYITAKSNYFAIENKLKENRFKLITEKKIKNSYDFCILNIVENYIHDEPSLLSELLFFDELQQNSVNENWIAFAEYYGRDWYYTLDIVSNKIFLVDTNDNSIQLMCATNEENFLRAIQEVFKLEIIRFNSNLGPIEDNIGEDFYQRCVKLSGVKEGNMFYRYILGV